MPERIVIEWRKKMFVQKSRLDCITIPLNCLMCIHSKIVHSFEINACFPTQNPISSKFLMEFDVIYTHLSNEHLVYLSWNLSRWRDTQQQRHVQSMKKYNQNENRCCTAFEYIAQLQ